MSRLLTFQRRVSNSARSWEDVDYTAPARCEDQVPDPWKPDVAIRNASPSQTVQPSTSVTSPAQSPPLSKTPGLYPPIPNDEPDPTLVAEFPSHQTEIPDQGGEVDDEPAPHESDPELTALDHELQRPDEFDDFTEERPNSQSFHIYDEYTDALEDPDLDIDEFVDGLHRPPAVPTTTTGQRVAHWKAVQIFNVIQPTSQIERADALAYLADLFEHLPHPATYSAIKRLSPRLNIDIIKTMVELREAWLDNEGWRLHRYGHEITSKGSRTGGFTWKLAYLLCMVRSEYPPDMMIEDDWITEWLYLKPGAVGYYSFARFIARKLEPDDALRTALRLYAMHVDPDISSLFD